MRTSSKGLKLIGSFEGLRLRAYPDPGTGGQPWTIGYGHTKGVKRGQKITAAKALSYLRSDVLSAERSVDAHVRVPVNQNRFDAMVSLAFNIGNSAFAHSTVVRRLNSHDYDGAGAAFMMWVRAGGRVMQGLVNRRAAERKLYDTPFR